MEPRAEFVHWLFATGILVLGLILLAQAIAGPAVWAMRRWRIYLWPGIAFGLGDPDVAGDDLLHQLGDPHGGARQLGAGADADGGGRARARARASCTAAGGGSARRSGSRSPGAAFLVHEQNPWFFARSAFLHHLIGWTLVARRRSFPLGLVFRPRSSFFRYGFGDLRARARGDALLRPRRRARLRPPLAARGGPAPVKRLCVWLAAVALVAPAAAWAHATLKSDVARCSSRSSRSRRSSSGSHFDQYVELPVDPGLRRQRARRTRCRRSPHGLNVEARLRAELPTGRLHRALARRSRPTATSCRASGRSACA